jgi:tetratricopeptide (TPR) repeat protein
MTRVAKAFFWQMLILSCALPAAAQAPTLEIRAAAEYRISGRDEQETGRKLALAAAKRKVLQDAATQLHSIAEIKAIPLPANQFDAILRAILEVEEEATRSEKVADGTVRTVTVKVRFGVHGIAGTMDKLRLDPNAVRDLTEAWKQAEVLYQQLAQSTGGGTLSATEQNALVNKLNANQLVSFVYAALARTEESPASSRVASVKGRQRALQLAGIAVMADPDSQETHLAMGDALIISKQAATAEAEYRQSLLLGPGSSRVHIKLAEALRIEETIPEAIAELREAIRIDTNSATAHNDLGFILAAQQNTAEAIAEYHEALRLDTDLIEAHNNLAIAFARQGRTPDAISEFREILRIDPTSVLGYYNLAIALADMEKDDESAEALRQAVHFNPNHFNARYNLGELFRLEGKLDEAVKQFQEYLRLAPDTPQNQRNIRRAADFVQTHENK